MEVDDDVLFPFMGIVTQLESDVLFVAVVYCSSENA